MVDSGFGQVIEECFVGGVGVRRRGGCDDERCGEGGDCWVADLHQMSSVSLCSG